MQFAFPDVFAPMYATLLVCGVIALVGTVVGVIAVRTAAPMEQGVRATLSTVITILLAVVVAAIVNPMLGDAQRNTLETEQRDWVQSEYNITLTDEQFEALRFPGLDPGEGTVTYGTTEVTQWDAPVTVKLISEDGRFSVVMANGSPLPEEAPPPPSDEPVSEP
jgi:hypothetical protein